MITAKNKNIRLSIDVDNNTSIQYGFNYKEVSKQPHIEIQTVTIVKNEDGLVEKPNSIIIPISFIKEVSDSLKEMSEFIQNHTY